MRLLHILLLGVAALLIGWLLWILGKPGRYRLASAAQQEQLDAMLPPGSREGNQLQLFTDGKPLHTAVIDDLQRAQSSIHMQFFKFEDDSMGRDLAGLLADKVAQGAEARVLYDDFVCRHWRRLYRAMNRSGVQAVGFNPVHWPVPWKRDYYRNHRKTIIIDGRVAYLGGYNLANRYVYGLPWGRWRDTMVRIEGPAVAQVQHLFLSDWCFATGSLPSLHPLFPALQPAGSTPVDVVPSGPIGHGPAIMHLTASVLRQARRYAWLESPYFIPTPEIREAMYAAARRGVDVRLLLPPRGDQGEGTQLASKSYFADALDAGVRIGLYRPGYMHSKIIVSDDRVGMVGSCNLDPRSHLLCQEVAAVVEDGGFARQLKAAFLADEAESTCIDPAEWAARPCRERTAEALMHTVAPLL